MPIIQKHKLPNGSQMAVWQISEPWEELLAMTQLNDTELEKVYSFGRESRKQEWLAARVLLKELSGTNHHISYHHNGAPYLDDINTHISISHTQGYAAVAFSEINKVAVDIEYPSARVLKISDRFLHDDEKAYIDSRNEETFQTVIWCAKEALYKWWGETEVTFKEHLRIMPFTIQPTLILQAYISRDSFYTELELHCTITSNYTLVYIL